MESNHPCSNEIPSFLTPPPPPRCQLEPWSTHSLSTSPPIPSSNTYQRTASQPLINRNPCKSNSKYNSNTRSKSSFRAAVSSSDSQRKLCTATQGRGQGGTAGGESTPRAPCSHVTVALKSLTQHRQRIIEQRGSAAVTISSAGSSVWLGMSPLPPDLPDPSF